MTDNHPHHPEYPRYKIVILLLLVANAILYSIVGTFGNALDAVAWLILLVLFELETEFGWHETVKRSTAIIHWARIAAIVGASVASLTYVANMEWVETVNSLLWVAVIVMLEWEVRFPRVVAAGKKTFVAATAALYIWLVALIPVWAWRGEWLDAYDAVLWIVAYATIELDVFKYSRRSVGED